MANHMKEVAQMLGVGLYEKFIITCGVSLGQDISKEGPIYYLSECGLHCDETGDLFCELYLSFLLSGVYTIKRQPWKPQCRYETYFYVYSDGEVGAGSWVDAEVNYMHYKLGNCYRTKEAAEADRDKWVAFYGSDEQITI